MSKLTYVEAAALFEQWGFQVEPGPRQAIALFANLSARTLACIAERGWLQHSAAGTQILLADGPCNTVHFVAAGMARVYRLSRRRSSQQTPLAISPTNS